MNILERIAAARQQTDVGSGRISPPSMPQASVLHRMLAAAQLTEAQAAQQVEQVARVQAVQDTPELRRVYNLPRRTRTDADVAQLVADMTSALRTPFGTMTLKPIQALALAELYECQGLLGVMGVGAGKTLTTYLAPTMVDAERFLLIVPAALKDKTREDFRILSAHWNGPTPSQYRIESFEALGRVSRATLLEQFQPELIVMDEAHRVKNPDAAVTKRVRRYVEVRRKERLRTIVVALSGTITKRSLRDYAHLASWALQYGSPLPFDPLHKEHHDLAAWADALDEKVNPFRRVLPGALIHFCTPKQREDVLYGGDAALQAVREAYRDRLIQTPGVAATQAASCDASILIEPVETKHPSPAVDEAFETLRLDWETPDGWPISDPMTLWRHARELAMGFFYRWNPRPPEAWLEARKAWAGCCREILQNNRRNLDSELMVTSAVAQGLYKDKFYTISKLDPRTGLPVITSFSALQLLERWREVKDSFVPKTEAVWISTEALDVAAEWMSKNNGVCWVEHTAFGIELSRRTGVPFYHRKGLNTHGANIQNAPGNKPAIASVKSNSTGFNLQQWSTMLVMSCEPSGTQAEQMIGREHREGQAADVVTVDWYFGCVEQIAGFWQSVADATMVEHTTGQSQRLVMADKLVPSVDDFALRGGFRWTK